MVEPSHISVSKTIDRLKSLKSNRCSFFGDFLWFLVRIRRCFPMRILFHWQDVLFICFYGKNVGSYRINRRFLENRICPPKSLERGTLVGSVGYS